MATLSEAKAYLDNPSYTDDEVQFALDAETAAQRRACVIPETVPADLKNALLRRVQRNLAVKPVTLVTYNSFEGGSTSQRIPSVDVEIRRLEAPYRRLVMG